MCQALFGLAHGVLLLRSSMEEMSNHLEDERSCCRLCFLKAGTEIEFGM